jgi:hypothetical protein
VYRRHGRWRESAQGFDLGPPRSLLPLFASVPLRLWLCVCGCVSVAVCLWLCVCGCVSVAVCLCVCIHARSCLRVYVHNCGGVLGGGLIICWHLSVYIYLFVLCLNLHINKPQRTSVCVCALSLSRACTLSRTRHSGARVRWRTEKRLPFAPVRLCGALYAPRY